MSKELVISSNRHETRVAVVEDDQIVEVYHQREQEYSLAGSIHKGRVTRVLPGMQSAFVDLGLERDAFLYVSDFFEDNDEYDKIVTSVEEKVLRMDKGEPAQAPVVVAPVPPAAEKPVEAAPPAVNGPPTSAPVRTEERDGRDRRGRRSRRKPGRQGQQGRGLPESKFFSPAARAEPPVEQEQPVQSTEDFLVLPGESLAKYAHSEGEPEEVEAEAIEGIATGVEDTGIIEGEGISENDPTEEDTPPVTEPPPADDDVNVELVAVIDAGAPDDEHTLEQVQPVLPDPSELAEEEGAAEAVVEAAEAEATEEGESQPEPARVITSLTATLREQGPRYLHRVSRRMRRKTRGGDAPPRPGVPPEARVEPQQRVASRPEPARTDKAAAPSIADLLREGQEIIVQIAKEPLGQKGARITSHIALPGRFLVYMPTVEHIGVSRKIASDEERSRLKRILQSHRAGIPGGFIVRTAGEGRSDEELNADMLFLFNSWMDIRQKAEKKPAPALVYHDLDLVERLLRDQLTSAFKNIWVDNEEVYESVLRFVQRFQPALVSRVKLYTRPNPIFEEFGVTPELEKALRPKVWLKSGGYIVINQTEALVAIDVNTGKFVGKSNRLEDTIVKTNTDAIREIVRQIRLRDLGGIIVVDFIDMDERKNRQKVMQTLEEAMRADRAPYKILQFNDFGLVAITRKRVKQSLERTLCSPCPYCEGAGYVKSAQTVIGEILQEAQKITRAAQGERDVTLRVNPDVAKLLKSNQNTYLQEIEEILGRNVLVKADPLLHQEKFDLA